MTKLPLRRWDHQYLGEERFPETLSTLEIEHFFTLDAAELARVRERRGPLNRLALALQIGFLKMTGTTLNSVELIPPESSIILAGNSIACRRGLPPSGHSIAGVAGRCSSIMRRRCDCSGAASSRRMPNAGWWRIFARKPPSSSTMWSSWRCARTWLVEHDYLLLRDRDIRRLVIAARRHHEQVLFKTIAAAVPSDARSGCHVCWRRSRAARTTISNGWVAVPSSRTVKGLEEQIKKVDFLKELGADRLVLPDLPLVGLEHFARRMTARKPAALARIEDPHRTIEVACFLRLTLLRVTDASLTLLDHQIAALWRGARERAEEARASRLRRLRQLLGDLAGLAGDEALDAAALRSRLHGLIAPL